MLRPADATTLTELGLDARITADGGFIAVELPQFPVPAGLAPNKVNLLLRLPMGFPDATPDMFWVDPPLMRADGGTIPGTESCEIHLGRTWQRWSRHIQGQWRPGVDNLATYLAYVRRCLDQAAGRR